METSFERDLSDNQIRWISTDDRSVICRIRKLAAEHPEEVDIKYQPEENGGYLYGTIPRTWLRIGPPPKRTMSEEQKAAAAERMRAIRKTKGSIKS